MRDKEDGDRGNSLFFTHYMIAMSVYPIRLEDPISNDAIDIELAGESLRFDDEADHLQCSSGPSVYRHDPIGK